MHPFARVAFHALLIAMLTQAALATPYTYIDATPLNTTLNGAALVAGSNYVNNGSSGSGTDGKWTYRTDSAFAAYQGGTAFESDNSSVAGDAESTAPLVTTITLPTIGSYEIVAVFAINANRDIATQIGAAPTASNVFTAANALNANQALVPLQIEFDGTFSNARLSSVGAAPLGQITTAAPNQPVQIYVNGFASTSGTDDERTQFEGIGYRLLSSTPPAPKHRDVFLIAGQSNADGRGLKTELTGELTAYAGQQASVQIHYTNTAYANADKSRYRKWMPLEPGYSVAPGYTGTLPSTTFGMEIGAAKVLTSAFPNPTFIKATRGGTALGVPGTDWYPAPLSSPDVGPLYKALIESTLLALQDLKAAGDSYTVHALFWHQGESDSSRTAEYGALLTTLIESIRRDLEMPNLRIIIGELAQAKPQAFRDVQWEVARSIPNVEFISSRGFTTSDAETHFDTPSMVTFGRRLGHALLPNRETLGFDAPTCATGPLHRQDECSATDGHASALQVVATVDQGDYSGGQAAGHVGASGGDSFTRRNLLPLASARSLQADFFPGDSGYDGETDADSSLLVAGWRDDANNDGFFADTETAIGLGLHPSGNFQMQIGATTHRSTGFTYQIDRWYRLTLSWSDPDANGQRTLQLFARDLASRSDLNNGQPVLTVTAEATAFDATPARWAGIGCRCSRGLVDQIRVVPPGFAAWAGRLYPALAGGLSGDDDQDGMVNAIEFAFGLDPLHAEPSSLLAQPVFGPSATTLSFSPPATQPGIFYQVEWSRNFTSWARLSGVRLGNLLHFTIPTAGEPTTFIRHRIEVTP